MLRSAATPQQLSSFFLLPTTTHTIVSQSSSSLFLSLVRQLPPASSLHIWPHFDHISIVDCPSVLFFIEEFCHNEPASWSFAFVFVLTRRIYSWNSRGLFRGCLCVLLHRSIFACERGCLSDLAMVTLIVNSLLLSWRWVNGPLMDRLCFTVLNSV